MTANAFAKVCLAAFVGLFFLYLLAPLLVMGATAFNSASFPRLAPFECFTVEWFGALAADGRLMAGLASSVVIGLGVVALSVPIGLAAALLLTQAPDRLRPWYYTVGISPILIPGVVLGIATLVFWDRLGRMFGASEESVFYDGIFLTIVGQTTFVSAYCLLIFLARLQRFDTAQEEAARDLGATPAQSFRRVLLPFLKPAVGSAAVLAFLASFENYNTTVFTSLTTETLVTVLASKVRFGISPSISALAVLIVGLTLLGAAAYEIVKRREAKAGGTPAPSRRRSAQLASPALAVLAAIAVAGVGTVYFAGTLGVDECKAAVAAEKQRRARERLQALPAPIASPAQGGEIGETPAFDLFAPGSLDVPQTSGDGTEAEPRHTGGPFAPADLAPSGGAPADSRTPPESSPPAPKGRAPAVRWRGRPGP